MKPHNATPEHIKAAVLADLETGLPYFEVAAKHGVAYDSARRWMRESGRTKPRAPSKLCAIDDATRRSCERMLRDGRKKSEIMRRLHIGPGKIAIVAAGMST